MKCLIRVNSIELQEYVLIEYRVRAPLHSTINVKTGMINTTLYFEMFEPNNEYIIIKK